MKGLALPYGTQNKNSLCSEAATAAPLCPRAAHTDINTNTNANTNAQAHVGNEKTNSA